MASSATMGVSAARWADPAHRELTHYHKFAQLAEGTTPIGPVWPVRDNPRTSGFPERLRGVSDLFNAFYKLMFITMQDLFSGGGAQGAMVDRLYGLMSSCLALAACYLVRQPINGAHTAGPTFEPHRFGADPWGEAAELAQAVSVDHSELTDVAAEASVWAVST